MLTSKQRANLKGQASKMDAIFQVGKGGVTQSVIIQTDEALQARELIKLTVLETCELSPIEAANVLANSTNSEVVQAIGRKIILYRENPKKKLIKID
ncbi:MAG: ribosome assembly RNA-binding protein YhbY [Clostridiales bacterium]|nr:ribosome assembly RNA-binding protein YhbY [Clostridiales bacterium]